MCRIKRQYQEIEDRITNGLPGKIRDAMSDLKTAIKDYADNYEEMKENDFVTGPSYEPELRKHYNVIKEKFRLIDEATNNRYINIVFSDIIRDMACNEIYYATDQLNNEDDFVDMEHIDDTLERIAMYLTLTENLT